jgi:hypothetical protein
LCNDEVPSSNDSRVFGWSCQGTITRGSANSETAKIRPLGTPDDGDMYR